MPAWLDYVIAQIDEDGACVLVNVAATAGSVPRETGARMVVTKDNLYGTIGGGQLEFEAIANARTRLEGVVASGVTVYPLGPELGQCCGGSVTLVFEVFDDQTLDHLNALKAASDKGEAIARGVLMKTGAPVQHWFAGEDGDEDLEAIAQTSLDQSTAYFSQKDDVTVFAEPVREDRAALWLFGAGHVGKAVAAALAPLPFALTWVDARGDVFPGDMPKDVTKLIAAQPDMAVGDAPKNTYFLVMTHSHPLDQAVCEAVLRRGDAAYLGLIGSKTKKAQFLSRLKAKGLSEVQLSALTCPIGLPGLGGKEPAIIAAAVAADLLMRVQAH